MAAAKTSRGAKAAAAAASIAAHLIFLAILVQQTSQVTPRHAWPTFSVELVPPVVTERKAAKPPPTKREARPPPTAFPAKRTAGAPPPLALPSVAPSPTVEPLPAAPPAEDPVVAAARQAVREGFGCNPKLLARLSAAEQEACRRHDRQYAARKSQGPGATASLDLEGRFVKPDPNEPYLVRKPEKGCKPRVGAAGGDLGSDEHFVPGITCVFRF